MQFLEEFKSKFIEFRELVDNLENISEKELREKG
jgi:ribosomal protein S17E